MPRKHWDYPDLRQLKIRCQQWCGGSNPPRGITDQPGKRLFLSVCVADLWPKMPLNADPRSSGAAGWFKSTLQLAEILCVRWPLALAVGVRCLAADRPGTAQRIMTSV
jgi:hypothetical protein